MVNKTKIIFLSLAAACVVSISFTFSYTERNDTEVEALPSGEINFYEGPWEDALQMAKDEGKLIFLDAMAAWCGPCKAMDKNVFTDPDVAKYYNENFVNVQMDMQKHQDGEKLSQKYEVANYPSLIFIDKKGKIVKKSLGYKTVKQFLELGKSVQ